MKFAFKIWFLIFTNTIVYSQNYNGGISDGFSTSNYNESFNIFAGGNADGFSTSNYNESFNIFAGGNADGFSTSNYNESFNIFTGGNADGFSTSNYNESFNIFTGGNADGFSTSNYNESFNIFVGGNADGFSTSNYNESFNIFTGGNADGFSLSNYNESFNIFAGGNADGFSMNLFDQNPLCSDLATVWNGVNWSNGLPNNTTQVLISYPYNTNFNNSFEACSCKNNSTILVSANKYISIVNDFINDNGSIEIKHQGAFVQVNNDAIVSQTGTYNTIIKTTELLDEDRFTYFSSPVQNQNLTVFNNWANMNSLWRFDESIQDWYQVTTTTSMPPAVGFAIQSAQDIGQYPLIGTSNFSGVFNNGIYSYPLTYNPSGIDDDNALVGNPYPSAINATNLLNNNPSANAFYFWTHNSAIVNGQYAGDDYAIWNNSGGIASGSGSPAPSGFIASGQGFFVDAVASGDLVFDNSLRVTNNNNDFRDTNNEYSDKIWLNLSNNDGLFNQILLNFTENGTVNFDAKLDATRFNTENPISFYAIGLNNERFAIQALPIISEDDSIPLGFDVVNESINKLKISIDHLENFKNIDIYLRDNLLNVTHDLQQSDYEFTVTNNTFNNRFQLIFNRSTLGGNQNIITNNENLIITNYTINQIKVKTKRGKIIKALKAYDVLGKLIIDIKPNKNDILIDTNLKQGTILFFKVKLEQGEILTKKFIKTI